MTTTLVVALLVVIALLIGVLIFMSVQFFRTLQKMADSNDRTHERWDALIRSNLDRVMAADFGAFKAYESAQMAPAGGMDDEDEEGPELYRVPDGVHSLRELVTGPRGGDAA